MTTDTAFKIVLMTVAISILSGFTLLFCLQINQLTELHSTADKQQTRITELQRQLDSFQAHVNQEAEFEQAMKAAAGKAGYWWAYVKLSNAQPKSYSKRTD